VADSMKTLIINNLNKPSYATEEGLNRLRVNFGFCGSDFRKVIITSSTPDEGKSYVSFQLWYKLAEAGKKVVLVDADLRKTVLPSRHEIRSEKGTYQGLAHYLSGQAEIDDVLFRTNIENAYMVPITNTISNPAILLQNPRMEILLNTLAESYDYVLVDTPPLGSVSDGGAIASLCDGALLVVRSGVTPSRMVMASMKQLEYSNCKLMGIVLSRVQRENNLYYYRESKYGYGYGYGYGEDGEDRDKKGKRRKKLFRGKSDD